MQKEMAQIRKGVNIEILSILWMIVEAGIAIGSGLIAHSLALVAFGADSIIELIAGGVLLWRLLIEMRGASLERVERAERMSSWVVGIALLLLAVYIVIAAIYDLSTHKGADSSVLGISLAVASGLIMPYLSKAKKAIGKEIGSKALRADGSCSIVCAYMAWTLLVGVALTAMFGLWWIDSIVALGLVYFVVKEGIEAVQEARGIEDSCGCCGDEEENSCNVAPTADTCCDSPGEKTSCCNHDAAELIQLGDIPNETQGCSCCSDARTQD